MPLTGTLSPEDDVTHRELATSKLPGGHDSTSQQAIERSRGVRCPQLQRRPVTCTPVVNGPVAGAVILIFLVSVDTGDPPYLLQVCPPLVGAETRRVWHI